jgi:hypothetical protein
MAAKNAWFIADVAAHLPHKSEHRAETKSLSASLQGFGGPCRARTCDILGVSETLFQLS